MNAVVLITQAEYARRRGVAKSAVHKAVNEGRISLISGKIDPAVADIQWERNTRARADSGRGVATPVPERSAASVMPGAEGVDADSAPPPTGRSITASTPIDYSHDRARREKYEADLAQLKLLEQQGELVRKVEVRAEIAAQIGQLRERLLQLSARLAHVLTPDAKVQLDNEIRDALASTARGS